MCFFLSVIASGNEPSGETRIVHRVYILHFDDGESGKVRLHADLRVFLCLFHHGQASAGSAVAESLLSTNATCVAGDTGLSTFRPAHIYYGKEKQISHYTF